MLPPAPPPLPPPRRGATGRHAAAIPAREPSCRHPGIINLYWCTTARPDPKSVICPRGRLVKPPRCRVASVHPAKQHGTWQVKQIHRPPSVRHSKLPHSLQSQLPMQSGTKCSVRRRRATHRHGAPGAAKRRRLGKLHSFLFSSPLQCCSAAAAHLSVQLISALGPHLHVTPW